MRWFDGYRFSNVFTVSITLCQEWSCLMSTNVIKDNILCMTTLTKHTAGQNTLTAHLAICYGKVSCEKFRVLLHSATVRFINIWYIYYIYPHLLHLVAVLLATFVHAPKWMDLTFKNLLLNWFWTNNIFFLLCIPHAFMGCCYPIGYLVSQTIFNFSSSLPFGKWKHWVKKSTCTWN